MREHCFELVDGKEASRTSMSTLSKEKIVIGWCYHLMFDGFALSKLGKSEGFELLSVSVFCLSRQVQ